MNSTQRHIIQTVYDKTGLAQFKKDMTSAQRTSGAFGTKIAKDAQFAGIGIKKSFDKAGDVITKKTATFVKGGKQMKVAWSESAKGAQALGVSVGKTGGAMSNMNAVLGKAMKRALIVAPVWLAIRSAMMLVIRTIRETIKAYVDLDDGLSRIRTVMHGTKKDIETDMVAIEDQIVEASLNSRIAMKDLAEGFYFLKTAGLTTQESMEAFEATMNLAIGTTNSMGESARAVAGIYNTMGKYIGINLTAHQKFQHIADVLAYTYSTQDVQLSELIQSYTKMAPYVTGLSDSFLELTTMLGFLNTRLLRGGRTGRLTGRAILQLTKNSEKLSKIFDITFDPDKPIDLLDTIGKIQKRMGKTGKITAEQGQIIQEVFATRGGVAIRLLIEHFDELEEQIEEASEASEGFAKAMKDIRMGTIAGQMERLKNVQAVLVLEFTKGYLGTAKLATSLGMLVDMLAESKEWALKAGLAFGFFARNIYELAKLGGVLKMTGAPDFVSWNELADAVEKSTKSEEDRAIKIGKLRTKELKINELIFKARLKGHEKELELLEKVKNKNEKTINKLLPLQSKLQKAEQKKFDLQEDYQQATLTWADEESEKTRHQISLMKIRGAISLEMAKYELQRLEQSLTGEKTAKEELEIKKAINKVTEEKVKLESQVSDKYLENTLSLLKIIGATELDLLNVREQYFLQLQEQNKGIGYHSQLLDIQLQKQLAIQNVIKQTRDLQLSAMEKYIKATEEERKVMKEVFELMRLSPKVLQIEIQRASKPVQDMFMTMQNIFDPKQYRAGLEGIMRDLGLSVSYAMRDIGRDIAGRYGATREVERYEGFTGMPYKTREPMIPGIKAPEINIVPTATFGNILISLPKLTLDKLGEEAGNELKNKIMGDPDVIRWIENISEGIFWTTKDKGIM